MLEAASFFSVFYGVIRLLLVKWYFRMVSPRNLSSYHSGGEDAAEHFKMVVRLLALVTDGQWLACKVICQRAFRTVGDKRFE